MCDLSVLMFIGWYVGVWLLHSPFRIVIPPEKECNIILWYVHVCYVCTARRLYDFRRLVSLDTGPNGMTQWPVNDPMAKPLWPRSFLEPVRRFLGLRTTSQSPSAFKGRTVREYVEYTLNTRWIRGVQQTKISYCRLEKLKTGHAQIPLAEFDGSKMLGSGGTAAL